MTTSQKRLHSPARRLRRSQAKPEPGRRAPADYPRGYIEQLARTFSESERTGAAPVASPRPRPARSV